jgi:hypothetical protein
MHFESRIGASSKESAMRKPSLKIATAVLCAFAAVVGFEADATPIAIGGAGGPAFQVDPIYFQGFDVFGLTGPGNGPDYVATSPVTFYSVGGAGADLSLAQVLQQPVYQHPQAPSISQNPLTNGGVPAAPTPAVPFVADSQWTITNTSGMPLEDVLLLFTKATAASGYPAVDVALDDFVYDVLEYHSASAGTLYFGALPLGDLSPGEHTTVTVRYVVADSLLFQGSEYVMPPFGLSALAQGSYVPEPTTAVLTSMGLAMLGRRARRSRA